jgi:tetratricopeptide (TPR) repeat protein
MLAARDDFELLIGSTPSAPFEYWGQVLNSPGGQSPTCPLTFKFLPKNNVYELEILKLKIENAVLKGGQTNLRGPISPSENTLIEFGKQAFQSIFVNAAPIRDAYIRSKAALGATTEIRRLKIKLRVDPPELVGLPWEYLYDESDAPTNYLGLKLPFIRCFELQEPARPIRVKGPLRILGMIANPSSQDWPTVDETKERRRINNAIDKLQKDGRISFEWVSSGTGNSLLTALLEEEWHIFHFIGHGGADEPLVAASAPDGQSSESGFIILVDENGAPVKKYASDLAILLGSAARPLKLAVLNCCESGKSAAKERFGNPAAALVRSGLSAVVAMQYPIGDNSAINMAEGFYKALANGRSVEDAVTTARIFIQNASRIEWGIPVLYMNSIDGNLFQFDKSEQIVNEKSAIKLPVSKSFSEKFNEFVRLNQNRTSKDLEILSELGRELVELKKDDSSLAALVSTVYYELGLMQQRANESAKAIASYGYAIELAPNHPEYRIRRANYNARLGLYELAFSDIAAAITLQPTNAEYLWIKGIVSSMAAGKNAGFQKEAINAFSAAIKLNANEVKYYVSRASAFSEAGRKDAALVDLDTAIGLAPDNTDLVAQRTKMASEGR